MIDIKELFEEKYVCSQKPYEQAIDDFIKEVKIILFNSNIELLKRFSKEGLSVAM